MANSDVYRQILARYPLGDWTLEERESGYNNTTRYVQTADHTYVLRIYENHKDENKLRYEHFILDGLSRVKLSFSVPRVVRTRTGESFTHTAEGKLAALFLYIPGVRPVKGNKRHVRSLGESSGDLTAVLGGISVKDGPDCAYPPYYELELPSDVMISAMKRKGGQAANGAAMLQEADELLHHIRQFLPLAPAVSKLPQQIIHGDIGLTNALVLGEKITGILDFEFATKDARAMELAVCLGELLTEMDGDGLANIEAFVAGFGSRQKLTHEEVDLLPDLIKLRRLDVFVHFLVRFAEGLDPIGVLREQTCLSAQACRFVEMHRPHLRAMFYRYLINT